MARKARKSTSSVGGEAFIDGGETGRLITRIIEDAPAVKGGILVTFRPKKGGDNRHEVLPATEVGSARSSIINFMRAGLVPV